MRGIRRESKSSTRERDKGSSASWGLEYCNLLFENEQGMTEKKAKQYVFRFESAH